MTLQAETHFAEAEEFAGGSTPGLENGPEWGFRCTDRGVEVREDEDEWRVLCEPLEVAAYTRDGGSENWGRLLVFRDRDGVLHRWAASAADLSRTQSGEVIAHLARLGFVPPVSQRDKNRLVEYVMTARPKARVRAVGRVGWEGPVFVLPDASYGGDADERTWFQLEGAPVEHSYRASGTLRDWRQRVAAPCAGNSRLVFAVSCAFAGPLLRPLNDEGGGFHLRGSSSVGKTTALRVAASVWGGGGCAGFVRSWRATDNGLEGVAVQHCDTFLPLDELGQVDGRSAALCAYMLANGQGKSRAGKSGAARAAASWRVQFLSTGEIPLSAKIAEDGRGLKARAGQEVRVLDIPADAGAGSGLFERLPHSLDGSAFSTSLTLAASELYGTPARAFIGWLCANFESAVVAVRRLREDILVEMLPADSDGQVQRAARRFALVAAAGEIARHAGVLPWSEGEACEAALVCFRAWHEARGGSGPSEIRDGIAQVRLFLEKHGASRFQGWDSASTTVPNRAGFVRSGHPGERLFYILPTVWRSEVCEGRDARAVAAALLARGILEPGSDGKPSRAQTVPALGQSARLYCINAGIFEGESDG